MGTPILKGFTTYKNEGLSFTERTYSLCQMFPVTPNIETEQILSMIFGITDVETHIPYREKTLGIECGAVNSRALYPTNKDEVQVIIRRIQMDEEMVGFYVSKICLNPAHGTEFIRMVSAEPFVHFVCDYVQEKLQPSQATKGCIIVMDLPEVISMMYSPLGELRFENNNYKVSGDIPTVKIYIVEETPPIILDVKESLLRAYYRNFDFYALNDQYINGEVAYNTIGARIETFFNKFKFTKGESAKNNYFDYSGETYEMQTVGALAIGRALGRDDIVDDVLGRVYTLDIQPAHAKCVEITNLYRNYLDSLSFSAIRHSSVRPDIYLLDKDLVRTQDISYMTDRQYNHHILDGLKDKHLITSSLYYGDKIITPRVNYFNNLSDRINMLKELAVLAFPTVTEEGLEFYLPKANLATLLKNSLSKPLLCLYKANDSLKYQYFSFQRDYTDIPSDDSERKEYLRNVSSRRSLIPGCLTTMTGTNKMFNSYKLSNTMHRNKGSIILEDFKVGDCFISIKPEMNTLEVFMNLRYLKNLLANKFELTDELTLDATEITECIRDVSMSIFEKGEMNRRDWILPEDWRSMQIPYEKNQMKKFTSTRDRVSIKDFEFVDKTTEVDNDNLYVHPDIYAREMKNYTHERFNEINTKARFGYDPVMNIRGCLSIYSPTAISQAQPVKGFGGTNSSIDNANIDRIYHSPINIYLLAVEPETNNVIFPIAGMFLRLGAIDEKYETYNVNPVKEGLTDPAAELAKKRRFIL